ncbi:MAG: FecR domain-containing protein [Verrucomicrobiota bacterium]
MKNEEFDSLLRDVLDGDQSGETLRSLGEGMKGDEARIVRYLDMVEMDEMLSCQLNLQGKGKVDCDRVIDFSGHEKSRMSSMFTGAGLMLAACVTLLLGVLAVMGLDERTGGVDVKKDIVAVLIDSEDCIWQASDGEVHFFGHPFERGAALRVKSGIARLAMNGNAGLALEGPATVELVSEQEVRVIHGKVSAYAPEEAIGFKLITPEIEIVDLGTRFATSVDGQGHTDVHVFEGEISVKGKGEKGGELLVEGQARRFVANAIAGSEIENDPSLFVEPPALEQLLAIAGKNDLGDSSGNLKPKGALAYKPASGGEKIAWQDFTLGRGVLDGTLWGMGFGKNPWMIDHAFTRMIPTIRSHSGKEKAGGYLLVRGRAKAEPSVANRVRRQLAEVLPDDYYFAIRARYRGLDDKDFFALWIDVHGREDATHTDVPTIGIREGRYFARLHREHVAIAGRPVDGEEFVLAGHYVWDEKLGKARIALWVDPVVGAGSEPEPDASSVGPERSKGGTAEFRYIGLRMGLYTEVSDELLVYGFSVAKTLSAAVEAVVEVKGEE